MAVGIAVSPPSETASVFHRPKSSSLACPRLVTKMLAGLMSRCRIPRVCGLEGVRDLGAEIEDRVELERAGAQPLLQGLAPEELHRDEGPALVLVHVEDRADVGVLERRSRLGFPLEPLECLRVARQLVREELQGDSAPELEILGLVDDAHAAAAELSEHAVVRDRLADH
jgi:hypothetical protein